MKNKSFYKDAPAYGAYFFDLIETDDLLLEFNKSKELTLSVLDRVTPELENYAYEPGKWTVKEVLRHIIDMERIFAYRAFRLSRFDDSLLSGVEQNIYIDNVKHLDFSLDDLREEYLAVRSSTEWIFKNITKDMLDRRGKANDQTYTARTLGFGTIGHNIHHINVVKTKYLGMKE